MSKHPLHDFGVVDEQGDTFEFHYDTGREAQCRLETVNQTELRTERTERATISTALWRKVSKRVVQELFVGMGEEERTRKTPAIKVGSNRLGPLIGRELAVLLITLMEEGGEKRVEEILRGWRELAREERWWLFAKVTAPGQRAGSGWRRAIFHGLSEPNDSHSSVNSIAKRKIKNSTSKQKTVVQQANELCDGEEKSKEEDSNDSRVESDLSKIKTPVQYGTKDAGMQTKRRREGIKDNALEDKEGVQAELF